MILDWDFGLYTAAPGADFVIYSPNAQNNLITNNLFIPIYIEYNFNFKTHFTVKTGVFSSYLIKSVRNIPLAINEQYSFDWNLKGVNRFDFGGILGLGLSHRINDKLNSTKYYYAL